MLKTFAAAVVLSAVAMAAPARSGDAISEILDDLSFQSTPDGVLMKSKRDNITTLNLEGKNCTDESVDAVKRRPLLDGVYLSKTSITPAGLKAIAESKSIRILGV